MSAAEVERTVGSVVAGKYRLIRVLGRGGMGVVYEAEHTMTRRHVAVKILHAHHRQTGDAAKRFINEAQAAGRVSHPNVVEVLDAGEDVDQSLYLVLELLHGHDLATLLMRTRQIDVADTITIVAQVLQALAVAHSQGIVHRDIKPENIYLTQSVTGDQLVKILDFGISKAMNPGDSQALNVTQTNTTVGTPHYMSPEQARGERTLDARADLWAVGVVLYECLAGKVPFDGESYNDQIVKVITEPHPPLSQFDVPYELSQIVDRALEKDRSRRYLKAADMLADIRQFIERHREYASVPLHVLKAPHNLPEPPSPIASVPPRPPTDAQFDFGSDTVRSPAIVSLYDTTNEDVPTTVRAIDSDHDGSRLTPLAGARRTESPATVPPPSRASEPRRAGPAALFSGPNRERNVAIAAGLVAFAILAGGLTAFLASRQSSSASREQPSATVTFQFVGIPNGARLVVGETPIFGSSTAFVPRGSSPVPVEISAPGFEPLRFEIIPTENHTIPVQMRPAASSPPPAVAPVGANPTSPAIVPAPAPSPSRPRVAVTPLSANSAPRAQSPSAQGATTPTPVTAPDARPRAGSSGSTRAATNGTLLISSASPCQVSIDGRRAGATPVRQSLPPGEHVVRCLTPPARIRTQNISISSGQISTVSFD